ncbi:hypothetical protein F4781DRAFT_442384 [Annulohypoxylon bovei var. microspora]|nr:hypothetical protein F4781DRAFT_442384 [Annulohypoxylon bovei var. microspora]
MAASLAQLGIQFMPSTGSCILDMAAVHGLFDSCSTIHIRVPENQHRIDVHSNMICIKPTQPDPGAYREQYMYPSVLSPTDSPQAPPKQQQKRPPSMERPGNTPGSKGGDGNTGGSGDPDLHEDDGPGSLATTVRTHVRPAYTYTSTGASTLTTQVTRLQSSALAPSPSAPPTTAAEHALTTAAAPTPTPTPQQQAPTQISGPAAPPNASPSPAVERPAIAQPPPAPEVIAAPPRPAYCGTTYVKMDVTTIRTLDPHDLDLYLNLLGIARLGLDLDHGVGGLVAGLLGGAVDDDETRGLRRELEHSYRVRCGVAEMRWAEDGGRGRRERVATAPSQMACLEECEKSAIAKARGGEVSECLGAAWHRQLRSDNCRFWTGGRAEFLPVERLRPGEAGEWDLVYL